MVNYKIEILEVSKELTEQERVNLKDLSSFRNLDMAVRKGKPIMISVDAYAELRIDGVKVGTGKYRKIGTGNNILYVLIDKDGTKYTTRTSSFWYSFKNLWKDMQNSKAECKLVI